MKIYDLHSHTTASDGQLTPTALVQRAVQQQVDRLAITDHDSTEGWLEASEAVRRQGLPLQLVPGVEITCQWQQQELHVIGLQFALNNQPLQSLLSQQRQYRYQRAQAITDYLAKKHGIQDLWPTLQQQDPGTALTRMHIASWLVQQRYGHTISQVFQRYLVDSAKAVSLQGLCSLEQAIQQIQAAGGQAVLAHPGGYPLGKSRLRQLLSDFRSANGDGLEVAYSRQTASQQQQLSDYAQQYGLLASAGSDFHYPGGHCELGKGLSLPSACRAIWLSWDREPQI